MKKEIAQDQKALPYYKMVKMHFPTIECITNKLLNKLHHLLKSSKNNDQYDQTYTSCHIVQIDGVFDLQWHKEPIKSFKTSATCSYSNLLLVELSRCAVPNLWTQHSVSAHTWTDVIAGK